MSKQKPRAVRPVRMVPVGAETLKETRATEAPHKLFGRDAAARSSVVKAESRDAGTVNRTVTGTNDRTEAGRREATMGAAECAKE
jgi:hypothetical protein